MADAHLPPLAAMPDSQERYRVWPDGTVQSIEDGAPYSWMSDDFLLIAADNEDDALVRATHRAEGARK